MKDWRWQAVVNKSREFDGVFYFGVKTTGIFCRPSCSSRTAKRQNVSFFQTVVEAENAGFRACLRCQPKNDYLPGAGVELIIRALQKLDSEEGQNATLEELSGKLSVSSAHLQKTFKNLLGLSPKEIVDLKRLDSFKTLVKKSDVTTALYESGFGSSRALYEKANTNLGMTPATYKKGGKGVRIAFTVADSSLGKLMIAATEKGICAVSFGDTAVELENELSSEFPAAEIVNDDQTLGNILNAVLSYLEGEQELFDFPLDLKATAFQMRVWAELHKIPYGETRSYQMIAESIGSPKSVRAVARACATNPVAVITPCHRIIAADGKLSGYRWGIQRKKQLLEREENIS